MKVVVVQAIVMYPGECESARAPGTPIIWETPERDPSSGSLKQDLIERVYIPKGPCNPNSYMGGCQDYGPFLGPYYNTAPII